MNPSRLRMAYRRGENIAPTGALAPGHIQANLAIVPYQNADLFEAFLKANPRACPLLARGEVGEVGFPSLGRDIDVRTDLPLYRVLRHGVAQPGVPHIRDLWRDDLVAFAIGCSLSFESDLVAGGVALRSYGAGLMCSAFDSALPNTAVGPFAGNMVVSMRAVRAEHVSLAAELTRKHPDAHGAPIHVGDPAAIGVDLAAPIDGIGLTEVLPDETPMFWACGVTMERALRTAKLPLVITHAPAHMLITDRLALSPYGLRDDLENCNFKKES